MGDVDHIVPIAQGGHKTDPRNLQTLCHACHSKKTATEDGGFGNPKKLSTELSTKLST